MSDILGSSNLQIYNNATFMESLPLQPISENKPNFENSENHDPNERLGMIKKPTNIDEEITETEREIARLSKKLETLKLKRSQQIESKTPSAAAKRGRIVPAKFLNIETPGSNKIQQSKRRGFSLGPGDIYATATPFRSNALQEKVKDKYSATPALKKIDEGRTRGFSLGPRNVSENATPARAQKFNAIEEEKDKEKNLAKSKRRGTSIGPMEIHRQTRIAQEAKKGKNVCMTTSPKSRKTAVNSSLSNFRNGIATVGVKKSSKMDEGLIMGVKPKALFEEKKVPLNTTKYRIVPSRYSLAFANNGAENKRRKWSLPEDEEKEAKKKEARNKRCLSLGGANLKAMSMDISSSPESVGLPLPKIKTQRCVDESPRDSGCAKRVADLVGKKCSFDELELSSSYKGLDFEDCDY